MLQTGSKAPEFSLIGDDNNQYPLSGYRGSWVVVYFYPKDDTPGCTTEACMIRDNYEQFAELDIMVFGISADSVESHKKFKEKYDLPFILLSDIERDVIQEYDAQNALGGTKRVTFVINPAGIIARIYANIDPATHAAQLLADMQSLMNTYIV